ncbi:hypothetical protein RIF29_16787 [Crotalaria pallida]|uniref:OTU domain-containing protein n=1 Tax=Crotalaria pallida TaxID=3830 RepID=A0AAN9IK29_CROPI
MPNGRDGAPKPANNFDPKPYVDEIYRQVEALDDKGVLEKKRYFQRLHEFVYPTTTSTKPPKYKVKTKGGVKGSRKEAAHEKSTKREPSHWENDVMEAFPDVLHQFIHKIIDVKADGNCGFRVLSLYRYGTEENYMMIRQEVIKEMVNNKVLYVDILGQSYYDKAYNALYVDGLGAVAQAKWFEVCFRYNQESSQLDNRNEIQAEGNFQGKTQAQTGIKVIQKMALTGMSARKSSSDFRIREYTRRTREDAWRFAI